MKKGTQYPPSQMVDFCPSIPELNPRNLPCSLSGPPKTPYPTDWGGIVPQVTLGNQSGLVTGTCKVIGRNHLIVVQITSSSARAVRAGYASVNRAVRVGLQKGLTWQSVMRIDSAYN